MDLYNPALPGRIAHGSAFKRSGWREWDQLTSDEQAAHTAAVEAAAKADQDAVQGRLDAWAAARAALQQLNDAGRRGDEAIQGLNAAMQSGSPADPPDLTEPTTETPGTGDTPKE